MAVFAVLVGSIAQWLTIVVVGVGAYAVYKGGGGTALGTLQTANRVLEQRVHELEQQARRDHATISELRGRTDVTVALAPLLKWTTHHEERAQERHDGTLKVLGLIAQRLGPDNGHG